MTDPVPDGPARKVIVSVGSEISSILNIRPGWRTRGRMGPIIDALIAGLETAERLDKPGYALGKAISRTGQIGGKPSKRFCCRWQNGCDGVKRR